MLNLMHRVIGGLEEPGWLQGLSMLNLTDLKWAIDRMMNQICHGHEKLDKAGPKEVNKKTENDEAAEEPGTSEESVQKQQQIRDFEPHKPEGAENVVL